MGILEHVDDRKIRSHVTHDERAECDRHEAQLADRGRPGDPHEHGIVVARADDRHAGLNQRETEREHESVVAGLGDHRGLDVRLMSPCGSESAFSRSSFQWPCFFNASATSFGM